MNWTVEAKMLPLVGVAGHLYIEIFDEAGNRVLQINGLAADPRTHKSRDIGLPGDFLKAFVSNHAILADTAGATQGRHPHKGQVLFQGSKQDILKAIKAIEEAAGKINQLGLRYNVFTQNSNSVFMHMIDVISSVIPIDFQALESVCRMKPVLPGINKEIGGRGGYQSLKERFNRANAQKPPTADKKTPDNKTPPPQP